VGKRHPPGGEIIQTGIAVLKSTFPQHSPVYPLSPKNAIIPRKEIIYEF